MTQPDNTDIELTFEQQQVLSEILESFRNNPSNSNKYRYHLFAQIDEYLAQEANKAEQRLLTELLGKLPEKRHIPLRQAEDGLVVHDFNTAIDEVVSVIEAVRKDLGGYADTATPTACSNQVDNSSEVA